jgi:hypothetical protein
MGMDILLTAEDSVDIKIYSFLLGTFLCIYIFS